jgi:hypothetical protein
MFDVYADETRAYDVPVFRQRGFLETVQAALPTIQAIVSVSLWKNIKKDRWVSCWYAVRYGIHQVKKIDKRKDPALRQQAEEVQSNLSAFIDYRKKLI